MNTVNEMLIKSYSSEDKIISDYYKYRDIQGNIIDIDGIINPLKQDYRQLIAPTDNQLNFQSCSCHSACTLIESLYWKHTGKLLQLDSLQVYSLCKQIDGMRQQDGSLLEYSMQAVLKLCLKDNKFDFLKNAQICTFFNNKQNILEYVKFLLHKHCFLQAGFMCFDGWYKCNQNDFIINCSGKKLGGHAVCICYADTEYIGIHNQWGVEWGSRGFALMKNEDFINTFMYGTYLDF